MARFPRACLPAAWWGCVAAALVGASLPTATATASGDALAALRRLERRLARAEQRLEDGRQALAETEGRAAAQRAQLERAGVAGEGAALSGLSRFLRQTEFDGWVAASWLWNVNHPKPGFGVGANTGFLVDAGAYPGPAGRGFANPYHPDHDAFSLDQVWFSLRKASLPESRAGFRAEVLFGKTADVLRGNTTSNLPFNANGSAPYVYAANARYLAPLTPAGLLFTAGRFPTPVGVEVPAAPENFNITRGLVYSLLQPIDHTGLSVGQSWDFGFEWMLGVANSGGFALRGAPAGLGPPAIPGACTYAQPFAQNADCDDDKAFVWRLAWAPNDALSFAVSGVWNGDNLLGGGSVTDTAGLVDVVVRWDPSARLSTWLDFDYAWLSFPRQIRARGQPSALGVAAAGRLAFGENTGLALRGEYVYLRKVGFPFFIPGAASSDPGAQGSTLFLPIGRRNVYLWSLTGTIDHQLAEHLTLRAEARYEQGRLRGAPDRIFYLDDYGAVPTVNHKNYRSYQVLLGVEAIYTF